MSIIGEPAAALEEPCSYTSFLIYYHLATNLESVASNRTHFSAGLLNKFLYCLSVSLAIPLLGQKEQGYCGANTSPQGR